MNTMNLHFRAEEAQFTSLQKRSNLDWHPIKCDSACVWSSVCELWQTMKWSALGLGKPCPIAESAVLKDYLVKRLSHVSHEVPCHR